MSSSASGAQVDAGGVGVPHEGGEDPVERVRAVEFIAPVGGEDEQRRGAHGTAEEAEEVEAGGVGPVQILQHQQERLSGGEGGEGVADMREERHLAGHVVGDAHRRQRARATICRARRGHPRGDRATARTAAFPPGRNTAR